MKIKICGIKTESDTAIMNKYLPDAAGFIFYDKSERYINPDDASELCKKLNKNIKKAGVFVNENAEYIIETAKQCKLDIIQLHGEENNKDIEYIKNNCACRIWKAVRIENELSLKKMKQIKADRYLLDAYVNEYGGEGKKFNWDILKNINKSEIILAGGINCENIKEAVNSVKPYMIDVSQGAATDGVKDENKVKKLIEAVRYYE